MTPAFALTEPAAGTDAWSGHLHGGAERDEYVLNGSKIFISNAPFAEIHIVFAKTDPAQGTRGMSAFIVEKETPGFSVGKAEHKLGIRGSSTLPLRFADCHIPRDALLGGEGNGFKVAMQPSTAAGSASPRRRWASPRPPSTRRSPTPRNTSSSASRSRPCRPFSG
jgi:butyryl-CoA dehydrogenase